MRASVQWSQCHSGSLHIPVHEFLPFLSGAERWLLYCFFFLCLPETTCQSNSMSSRVFFHLQEFLQAPLLFALPLLNWANKSEAVSLFKWRRVKGVLQKVIARMVLGCQKENGCVCAAADGGLARRNKVCGSTSVSVYPCVTSANRAMIELVWSSSMTGNTWK